MHAPSEYTLRFADADTEPFDGKFEVVDGDDKAAKV